MICSILRSMVCASSVVVWHAELATPGAWSELCVTNSSSVRNALEPRTLVIWR